jgi:hypothetical protein
MRRRSATEFSYKDLQVKSLRPHHRHCPVTLLPVAIPDERGMGIHSLNQINHFANMARYLLAKYG